MAFYTSSALDTLDMMNQVVSFLTSNGYTLIHTKDTDNLSPTPVTCREVCLQNNASGWYITFLTTNTNEENPLYGDSASQYYQSFYGTGNTSDERNMYVGRARSLQGATIADEDPYMGVMMHNSYTPSIPWYQQPDAKKMYKYVNISNVADFNTYSAMAGNDSGIPTFWIFLNSNPHCVHIVAEYQLGYYSHMTIGELEKSHTYVGGQYVVGSARPVWGDHCYDGYLGLGFMPESSAEASYDFCKLYSSAMYCEGDGDDYYVGDDAAAMAGWGRCVQVTGINNPYSWYEYWVEPNNHYQMTPNNRNGYASAHSQYNWFCPMANGYQHSYNSSTNAAERNAGGYNALACTYDPTTGQAAPIPLTGWCEHKGGGSVYLGSYVHVAVIQMSVYSGKEEFTLGGETYQVFPLSALLPDSFDNSPAYGIGGRDRTRKEANNYQLGLAIRKVI